jgi:hypothetical protein
VSSQPSRWGWKIVGGDFAFFTMTVRPGPNPDVDRWTFELEGVSLDCLPQRQGSGWQFSDCRGLRSGDHFRVVIAGNDDLDIDSGLGGQSPGKLLRVQVKDEPWPRERQLLWRRGPRGRA